MTKHAVGLVLFSFIVGTSGFISSLFSSAPDTVTSISPSENYAFHGKKKKRKRRCRHRKPRIEEMTATVTSAVFDSGNGQLTTTLVFKNELPENFGLDLHFYVRDEYGTRYLKTETLNANVWTSNYINRFDWMSRFGQMDDLYVIPSIKTLDEGWTVPPDFDVVRAAPVKLSGDSDKVRRASGIYSN